MYRALAHQNELGSAELSRKLRHAAAFRSIRRDRACSRIRSETRASCVFDSNLRTLCSTPDVVHGYALADDATGSDSSPNAERPVGSLVTGTTRDQSAHIALAALSRCASNLAGRHLLHLVIVVPETRLPIWYTLLLAVDHLNTEVHEIRNETQLQMSIDTLRAWRERGGILLLTWSSVESLTRKARSAANDKTSTINRILFFRPRKDCLLVEGLSNISTPNSQAAFFMQHLRAKSVFGVTSSAACGSLDHLYLHCSLVAPLHVGALHGWRAMATNLRRELRSLNANSSKHLSVTATRNLIITHDALRAIGLFRHDTHNASSVMEHVIRHSLDVTQSMLLEALAFAYDRLAIGASTYQTLLQLVLLSPSALHAHIMALFVKDQLDDIRSFFDLRLVADAGYVQNDNASNESLFEHTKCLLDILHEADAADDDRRERLVLNCFLYSRLRLAMQSQHEQHFPPCPRETLATVVVSNAIASASNKSVFVYTLSVVRNALVDSIKTLLGGQAFGALTEIGFTCGIHYAFVDDKLTPNEQLLLVSKFNSDAHLNVLFVSQRTCKRQSLEFIEATHFIVLTPPSTYVFYEQLLGRLTSTPSRGAQVRHMYLVVTEGTNDERRLHYLKTSFQIAHALARLEYLPLNTAVPGPPVAHFLAHNNQHNHVSTAQVSFLPFRDAPLTLAIGKQHGLIGQTSSFASEFLSVRALLHPAVVPRAVLRASHASDTTYRRQLKCDETSVCNDDHTVSFQPPI